MAKPIFSGKQKSAFRRTKAWTNFRAFLKKLRKVDYVTRKPLSKRFQVHHMDLDSSHYTNLDPNLFETLNPQTHETAHWLYERYIRDPSSLDRMCELVKRMAEINQFQSVR